MSHPTNNAAWKRTISVRLSSLIRGTIIGAPLPLDDSEDDLTPILAVQCADGKQRWVYFYSDAEENHGGWPVVEELL